MGNCIVIARFAQETDEKMNRLKTKLAEQGYAMPEWPPHITIGAYEELNEQLLCEWTAQFTAQRKKIGLAFYSLSIFPPGGELMETAVLCLNPSHSKEMVDFYYAFHEKYEEYCTGIGRFNSIKYNDQVIHATIGAIRREALQKALELSFESDVFGLAQIVALEVHTYPLRLIARFDLH